jgi:hypothetical protein
MPAVAQLWLFAPSCSLRSKGVLGPQVTEKIRCCKNTEEIG